MKITFHPTQSLRQAMHLLFAAGLLLGLWSAGSAHAQPKMELIEMPLIKKFKEEKAAAAAAAASEAAAAKHAPEKPAAKDAAHKHEAPQPAAKVESAAPAAKHGAEKPTDSAETAHKHEAAKPVAKEESAAHGTKHGTEKPAATEASTPAPTGAAASESVKQLRQALSAIGTPAKVASEGDAAAKRAVPHKSADAHNRLSQRARALALARGEPLPAEHGKTEHGGEVHWAYEGENGPQAWGKLKSEFNLCAIGKRQSPIAINDDATLQGPAEAVQFHYTPSTGSVVNNGHTIQVDVEGDNSITVRSSTYKLLQFHFHTPSEEMINSKRYAMVVHMVHKNEAGQLAVVAVLLEVGEPNALIDTVWTYMPLDTNDRVRIPNAVIDMNEILPADQRYYQFMGSLTTPPCTEGVLWMVIKQPLRISQAQFKVFSQQFPLNARPVQAVNGRPVREAK